MGKTTQSERVNQMRIWMWDEREKDIRERQNHVLRSWHGCDVDQRRKLCDEDVEYLLSRQPRRVLWFVFGMVACRVAMFIF